MSTNEPMPPEVARTVALLAAAILNAGRGSVADAVTLEMARKFEAYVATGAR